MFREKFAHPPPPVNKGPLWRSSADSYRESSFFVPTERPEICALRDRFLLDTLVRREPTNLPSTLRDTLRFTFVSLRRKRSFSWRQSRHQINGGFLRQVIGTAGSGLL